MVLSVQLVCQWDLEREGREHVEQAVSRPVLVLRVEHHCWGLSVRVCDGMMRGINGVGARGRGRKGYGRRRKQSDISSGRMRD